MSVIRWTPREKEKVVLAVAQGQLKPSDAYLLHGITAEELASWQALYAAAGRKALRARYLQHYQRRSSTADSL